MLIHFVLNRIYLFYFLFTFLLIKTLPIKRPAPGSLNDPLPLLLFYHNNQPKINFPPPLDGGDCGPARGSPATTNIKCQPNTQRKKREEREN